MLVSGPNSAPTVVPLHDGQRLTIYAHFLKRGQQGGVELFLDNLLSGLRIVGSNVACRDLRERRLNRFVAEQFDILREDAGNILFPNYYLPPIVPKSINSTVVVHDLLFMEHPQSLPRLKLGWLRRTIPSTLRRADRVIAISEFTRAEILRHYGNLIAPDRVQVIHNPVDLERLQGGKVPDAIGHQPYVLSPSSGFWHKNVALLLRAFSRRPELAAYKLVLVGQRPSEMGWSANTAQFRSEYGALVEKGSAIELGYVPDATLGALYTNSACVAFPSLYEGFGMPIFEALGMGANVVCGRVGAVAELCSGMVSLVDNLSSEDEWVHQITSAAARTRSTSLRSVEQLLERLHPSTIARHYSSATTQLSKFPRRQAGM